MPTKITLRINGKESHLSADTWQQNGGMDGYAKDYGDALQVRVKAKDGSTGFIPVTDWGNAKGQGYQLLTTYYGDTKPQQPSGVVDQPLNNGERRAQGISDDAQPISAVQPHKAQQGAGAPVPVQAKSPSLQPSLTPDQQARLSQQMARFERWLNTDNVTPDTSKATSLIDAANKNLFGKIKNEEARRSHPIGKAYSMDEHGNVVENKPAEKYLLRTQGQQEDMVNESLRGISARYGKDVADKAIGIGNMKATNEALQSANEHINGISPVAGDTYGMQQWSGVANANRHTDPKAILSDATNILKGTFNNKQFIDNARAEAKRIGMDEQEYIKAAKENTSEQVKKDIYTKLIQSEMPKSHIDYIMKGLSNSIAGLVVGGINKTKGQREVAAIASQMTEKGHNTSFTPNFWDKLGSVSASFLADAPFFGVSGELSGQAIKGIAERQLTRLTATGMSKGAAQRVIASKMRSSFGARMADMVGKGAIGGGINLGTYNALHETARQLADQDINPESLAKETAKGIVTGAALGVGGGLTNAATYELSGLPKVLGKVGGFGTEGLIFTATGRALDGSDKSWVDDLASSYAQLAVMKLTSNPAKTLDNIANFRKAFDHSAGDRSGGLKFTAEEQNEIKQSTGGNGLVESLTGAEAYLSRWRNREAKDDVGNEGKGLVTLENGERMKGKEEMIRKNLSDNYENLMRDKNISYSTKQKVRYLLGGKMDIYVPLASGYTTDSDGKTFTVTTNDKDGNRIEQRTFKSEQEANDYTDKLKEAIDKDAKSEKDYSAALAAYNDLIAQDGASEADIKKVIRGETTGDEQKDYAIKSRYTQLFSEYAKQQPRPTRNAEQPQENQGRIEGESVQPTEQPIGAQSKVPQNVEGNNDGLLKEQEAKGSDTGQTTLEETQANSYQNGYDAPDEQKNDVKRAYEKAQTRLASMLPDNIEEIENHPMDFVRDNPKFPTLSEEQKNAVYDYVQAKTSFDGMVHHVQDEMDARVTASDKEVDGRVSQVDGAIHPISLKTIDDNGQSKKAYIINGNVQMLPDGTMVDTEKSDKTIVIRDAVTGETSMIDPREILSMDEPIDAEKEKRTAADAIRQAYSKQEADKIDGVLPFAPGDTYAVVDGQGHPHNVSIVGDAVDEGTGQPIEGAVLATVDGQQAILPKDQIQAMSDAAKDAKEMKRDSIPYPFELNDEFVITTTDGRDVRGTITAGADSDGNVQIATDEPVNGQMVSVVSPDELSRSIKEYNGMTATQQEEAQPAEQSVVDSAPIKDFSAETSQDISPHPENAMQDAEVDPTVVTQQDVAKDELPRDDDGNLVYDKVPVQKTIEDLYDGSLDDNEIKDFVDTNIKESDKAYKVLEKKAPKMGANKAKYLAAKKEWQSNLDEAKRKADYWKEVHAEQQRITNTTPDQVQEVQDEISGKNAVDELNANKEQVNFTSPLDMATQFVRGAKITPKSFKKETGLTTADQNKYVGMISNNGKSIERLGEELATMDDNENGGAFFHGDSNEARSAIIEALGEVRGKGGKKAQDMAEQDAAIAAYAQQRDNVFHENYGMGYEDYLAFEERFLPDMLRKYSNFDEDDYNNTYADEIAAQLKQDESYEREPITEGEQPGNDTSVEVLHGSPSDDTGGVAVPGDEGRQVETGSNSDAQDGTVSEEPRGEVSQEADTFTPSPKKDGEDLFGYAERVIDEHKRKKEEENVDTNPSEAQKEAGNYKKGHIVIDGFDISIEQPKGSVRKGKDKDGTEWETLMHNTYGYIRGTESVDGDHIDIFLSDDPTEGNVYVVDQVKNDGTFDEHKVMYGFADKESAEEAYLSNYSIGWKGLGNITEVSKEDFKKWVSSSKRKTKPFSEYKIAQDKAFIDSHIIIGTVPKEKKPTSKKSDTKAGTKAKPEVKQPSLLDFFDQQVTDEIAKENEETEEKTENNQEKTPDNEENSVSSQSEEKPVTEVTNTDTIGDSEQYQQRKHEEDAFVQRIGTEIEDAYDLDDKPLTMTDIKQMVKDYPHLADLSDTDLQEMVELAMSNLTRRVAQDAIGKGEKEEREAYDKIVGLYNAQPQLNARDSTRVELQQYSTPTPFAFLMGQFASRDHEVKSAFDPTAGNGALTICFDPKICEVNEIDDRRLANLRHQNFGKVTSQDGLQPFAPKVVDAVLTNPPFGTTTMRSFDGGTYDITSLEGQIVINALDHMKDDGRAAIIIGGNNSYRSNGSLNPKDAQFLGYLYTHYNVVDVINVDGKLYGRNGTKYPVRMILIKGRRNAYKDGVLQRVYPPVQKNARAEQVTTFDELYKRIQDDILSAKQLRLEPVDDVQGQSGLADNPRQPVQHSESDSGTGSRPVGGSSNAGPRHTPGTRTTGGHAGSGVAATDTKPAGGAKPSTPAANRPANGTTAPASSSNSVHGNESNGSSQPVGGRTDRPDSNAGRPASSRERLKPVALTAEKVHYPNQSQSMALNSMVPANQAEAIADNLEKLGDVDQSLVDELGYSSKEELYSHLASEQIDSVALAIHQIKQGKAFIIGDMTGIGKGRQGAALIRWAVKQGKTPIYLTQKPTLFSDNYRDLVDIGSDDLVPFIMGSKNQNSDPNITDAQGNIVHRVLPDAAKKAAYEQIRDTGKLPEGYDFLITSYSQLQNGTKDFEVGQNGEITQKDKKKGGAGAIAGQLRRDAFERLAQGNIIIMDESHTVGGSGNTGLFMQTVIPKAAGATFMSATFAKRADNMPIYALKTDLSESGIKQGDLIDAVNKGGVTLQELMSKQLVESGQMIRRERDFTGVTIDWLSTSNDEASGKADQEKFDVCAEIFNDIRQFQDDYVTPVIEDISEGAAETGGTVGHKQGTKDMGVNNAPFASKMFNLVNQLLLSMKVNAVVDRALVNLKKGEKPIITFSNTMEGFLEEAPQGVPLDKVPSFSVTLKHALDGVMRWTKKNEKGGTVESGYVPLSKLSPEGQQKYKDIAEKIRSMSVDLPISPMDAIKMRLQQAGYKVGEITGRKLELNATEDGKYIIEPRKGRDKKAAARDFNSGDLDVLLINKSGSTGISLHASSKFKDQKPRVMIAAQFQSDINDEVQMRGRNDRTGQVHRGRYEYLVSSIPAEQRLQMMFKQKLKSLDANTTSSQKSKFNEMDIVDFLNKYGDRIAYDYMVEHPEIEERLGDPLGLLLDESKKNDNSRGRDDDSNPATDAASKVCRRLAFLPVADQRKVLNDISAAYQTKIDMLNESGQNDLVITTMPLRAKTVRKQIWQKGTNPNSGNAFADNTYLEQCEVDVLKKPMRAEEIRKMMSKMRDGKSWEDWKEQTLAAMRKHFDDYKADTKAKMDEDAKKKAQKAHDKYVKDTQKFREQGKNTYTDEEIEHMAQLAAKEKMDQENERIENRLKTIEGRFTDMKHAMFLEPGKVVIVPDMSSNTLGLEGTPAIFLGYSISKDFSISSSTRTFATLDGRRTVRLPLNDKEGYSRIVNATRQQDALAESVTLDNWDSKAPTQTRKTSYIVTGNLLKAIVDTQKNDKTHGRLITFSDINGNTRQGILLPDKFEEQDLVVDQPISTQFEGLVRFDLPYVESIDGRVRIEYDNWRGFKISVPKSTKQGGEYFLDRQLRSIIGGEFTTKGNKMVAWVDNPSDLKRLFTRLTNMAVTVKGKAKLKDVKMPKVEEKPKDEGKTLFRTSDELFEEYPTWLSGQTTDTGQHTTQITSTKKTYEHIGDWMKKEGMDGAKILDASSGLGAGTEALRDMGFDVDDVEPYPSENRKAPTYRRYEDIDRKYDVVISNAVLNVIPDDWRADVLKSMADKVNNGGKLIINVRDVKSIENQKQKIELDSPSEILVTDKKGNIRAYQKGFTKQELKDWVKEQLGDGWQVDIANESNSGVKSGTAVVVTRTADAVPLRYRDIVTFKDGQKLAIQPASFSVVVRGKTYNFPSMQAVQDMTVRNGYSVEDGQLHIDYVGTFPIKTEGYKVEGMTSDHPTKERLLDAFRNKYPQYHSVIEGDNIVVEPWSKLLGTIKRTPAEQRKRAAYAQRDAQRAINTVEELAKQMNMSGKVTVLTRTTGLRGRYKRAKGWYDVRTGKITIVLPNHSSVSDVISTLLHEGVGHYGLRQLFGEHFDDFLDNVYMNAEDSIREEIYRAATRTIISGKLKRNIDEQWTEALHEATEEYLSRLAEDTDFERAMQQGWWGRIKQFFLRMLAKARLYMNIRLSDNELRYILWKSYDNLVNPGERTLFKQAEDIDMQQRMGVGNFRKEEEPTSYAAEPTTVGESRFRDDNDRPTTDDIQYLIKEESSTGKPVSIDRVSVRGDYEKQIASGLYQFQEAMQDSMLGLKTLMMDIWKANGKEGHIFDIPGYENPYLLENAMSSANQAQAEIYGKMIIKPLIKAIAAFEGKGYRQDDVTDYMLAKHGLERNDYMRRKTAEEKLSESDYAKEIRKQERYLRTPGGKDDEAAKDRLANMKDQFDEMVIETMQGDDHDYSGITSLTKESDVWAAEEIARKMVNDFESNAGEEMTNNLWERTNDATKATLRKLYDSGLMTKANYEKVRDMYKNYVPLRGWDETTTEDVYTYMNHRDGAMRGSIMKKAEGRRSKADDPIATIEAMAEAGISQGNRNLMKQAFLNFVQNHPSDLVSVDDIWLRYNDVTEEWETVFPQLSNDDTAEDVRNKVEAFNQRMVELSNENPEKYKRGKDDVNIPYVVVPGTQSEHEILVRRGGRPYVMVINGNPRAAQAVNGLTNPDVEVGGAWGNILKGMEKVNRFISAMVTTRFPDFVASNFVRDAEYSNAMSWVKESPNYAARFGVNFAKNNPAMIGYLLNKFKKGSLDINDETQKMFQDFMVNGGETGYTIVRDIEAHKKKIHEEIRKANGKLPVKRAWQLLGEKFDDVNRSVENCARFNAFLTSRQFGRSVERSIWDAKEVSVNFNKKGAGARFLGTKGMTTLGNTGAFMSGVGRTGFIFWNAGVQGLYNSGGTTLRNPRKALSLMASLFLLGSIIPSLSGDGGDDDKNNYYNLPSAIRRTSICFRAGDVWLSIPLAIEYRALYGLGELATSVMSGNEKHDDKELVAETVKQLTQIMPLDFMEGGGGYGTLVPSSVKPIYESIKNEDWTGLPLYKETPYNTNKPDWTKAYKNANKELVDIAKGISRATGGNDAKKGAVDVNPAEVENILEGYLGGAARTVNMLVKSGETMFANRDFEWRNVPIANRFIKGTDERTQLKTVKDRYYNYLDEFKETKRLEREYKNRADKGVLEYAEELNFLYNSKEYLRMTITEDFVKEIGKLNEQKNNADDDNERKAIESEQDMLMTEVVNILQQQEENK